jgi:hypothetical protein
MRIIPTLPIAAAAMVAGAAGAWGLGLASPRAVAPGTTSAAVCSPVAAFPAIELRAREMRRPRSMVAALRYRAETCSGDYVCDEAGAWEVFALPAVLPAMRQ